MTTKKKRQDAAAPATVTWPDEPSYRTLMEVVQTMPLAQLATLKDTNVALEKELDDLRQAHQDVLAQVSALQAQAAAEGERVMRLLTARDAQAEAAARTQGQLAQQRDMVESQLAKASQNATHRQKRILAAEQAQRQAEDALSKVMKSKRWLVMNMITQAIRRPGLHTLTFPYRFIRLLIGRSSS